MLGKRMGAAGEGLLCVGGVVVRVLGEGVWSHVLLKNSTKAGWAHNTGVGWAHSTGAG